MYKKQMQMQKILCLLTLVASAVVFLYSLGIMTDLYDSLYSTMRNSADLSQTSVTGSYVYYAMQDFNGQFLKISIVLILLACLLYLTNTHVRRRYYIGNYVAVCLNVVAHVGVAFWAHGWIEFYKAQFKMVDFEALKKHSEMWKTLYTESTFWFDAHYCVFAITILLSVLLVVNTVWKIKLMKEEAQLIGAGKGATA